MKNRPFRPPMSGQKKRTPFRRPGEHNLPRPEARRSREAGNRSLSPSEAMSLLTSEDFHGYSDRPFAKEMVERLRKRTTEDLPTEKLQKALADAGVGSRREMERLIEAGHVTVNGATAKLGDRVTAAVRSAAKRRGRRAFSCTTRWRAKSSRATTPKAVPRSLRVCRVSRRAAGSRWAVWTSTPKGSSSLRLRANSPTASCTRATKSSANTPCA